MDIGSITSSIVSSHTAPAEEAADDSFATDIPSDQMGSRLAILGKKEKGIREREASLNKRLEELEDEKAKYSKYSKFDDLNDDNAMDFFKEKGLSLEKIQEKWLSSLSDDDLDPVQKRIRDLETKLAAKDSEYKKILDETLGERDTKAKQAEIEQQSQIYNAKLKEFVAENAETYDLINTFEATDEVFKVIKDVYLKSAETGTPKLLKFDEACELYETKLAEMVTGMKKSNKVRSLLGENQEESIAQLMGQKTIDSSYSQSQAASSGNKTENERMQAAAKLFESMRG